MPRDTDADPPSPDRSAAQDIPPTGGARCQQRGCELPPVAGCHYLDAGGHLCVTAWCEQHGARSGVIPYCRRHAGIVSARAAGLLRGPLPRLDSRSPSLLAFVTQAIGEPITQILTGMAAARGEKLETTPVEMFQGDSLRWHRTWVLRGRQRESLRLSVAVDENEDPEMSATVNDRALQFIPPWIVRRMEGTELPADEDLAERRQFYAELVEHIRGEIQRILTGEAPEI